MKTIQIWSVGWLNKWYSFGFNDSFCWKTFVKWSWFHNHTNQKSYFSVQHFVSMKFSEYSIDGYTTGCYAYTNKWYMKHEYNYLDLLYRTPNIHPVFSVQCSLITNRSWIFYNFNVEITDYNMQRIPWCTIWKMEFMYHHWYMDGGWWMVYCWLSFYIMMNTTDYTG